MALLPINKLPVMAFKVTLNHVPSHTKLLIDFINSV